MQASPADLPCLALFDYAAAFASVIHEWMFHVLDTSGWPLGLVNLIKGTYHNCRAFVEVGGHLAWMCTILSGVLQGCPLSGTIFALIMEPFLRMFLRDVVRPGLGHVLACADDIGAVVNKISSLQVLARIFRLAEACVGLTLKPGKCIVVPLHSPCTCHVVSVVRDRLATLVPRWSGFLVKPHAKYLGIWLGPSAGSRQWRDQLAKWRSRVSDVASLGLAAKDAAFLYNTRCINVLSYVWQLKAVPRFVLDAEAALLAKIFKLPCQALRLRDLMAFSHVGGPKVHDVARSSAAAMIRMSSNMSDGWWPLLRQLQIAAAEHLSAREVLQGKLCPSFWDEVPIVCLLHGALRDASSAGLCPSPPPLLPDSLNPFSLPAVHAGFRFPIGPIFQKDATNVLRERFLGETTR